MDPQLQAEGREGTYAGPYPALYSTFYIISLSSSECLWRAMITFQNEEADTQRGVYPVEIQIASVEARVRLIKS